MFKVGDYVKGVYDYKTNWYTKDGSETIDRYVELSESNLIRKAKVLSVGTDKGGNTVPTSILVFESDYTKHNGDIYSVTTSFKNHILFEKIDNETKVTKEIKVDKEKQEVKVEVKANDISLKGMEEFASAFGNIAEKIEKLTNQIDDNRHKDRKSNERLQNAVIEGVIDKAKELATEDLKDTLKKELDSFIRQTYGYLPQRIEITNNDIKYEKVGIFHNQFENVLKLVNLNLPVFITGPAGTGKNFMAEQVASALNIPFYYTSSITQEYKLTGFIDGGGVYHETEFYKALTNGGLFMLDEMDASIPECLIILNGALANGYFDFPTGRVKAHKDFRVICAGNTVGLGADSTYTGRNVIDGATLDRFVLVDMDYDKRVEEMLCPMEDYRNFVYELREAIDKNKLTYIVGMRCLKNGYVMLKNGFDKDFVVKSCITKGWSIDDITMIKKDLSEGEWKNAIK